MKCFLILAFAVAAAHAGLFDTCTDKTVPSNMCAVMYDDDDCDGWALNIPRGYTELSIWKRNDAEAVVVKPGCRFIGYDHADSNLSKRGRSMEIDATRSSRPRWRNLDGSADLEEDISAVDCVCGGSRPNFNG